MAEVAEKVVRYAAIGVLAAAAVVSFASIRASVDKARSSANRMKISAKEAYDNMYHMVGEFQEMLERVNKDFKSINARVDVILNRTYEMLDPNDVECVPGSVSFKIRQILIRVADMLDPRKFDSLDPKSADKRIYEILKSNGYAPDMDSESLEGAMGTYVGVIRDNFRELEECLADVRDKVKKAVNGENDKERIKENDSFTDELCDVIKDIKAYGESLTKWQLFKMGVRGWWHNND